jgi:hypothetical protein
MTMWKSLVPEKSLYEDAVRVLGEPTGSSKLTNGVIHEFCEGRVRISFLEHRTVISKIRVLPHESAEIPQDLSEATTAFGAFDPARFDKLNGMIYERPGIRLACDNNAPHMVRWIEFFQH